MSMPAVIEPKQSVSKTINESRIIINICIESIKTLIILTLELANLLRAFLIKTDVINLQLCGKLHNNISEMVFADTPFSVNMKAKLDNEAINTTPHVIEAVRTKNNTL